jgi:hypothetical protein
MRVAYIVIAVLLGTCALTPHVAHSQNNWSEIKPGLERLNGEFSDHGRKVAFVALRCDPKKNKIRVVDTFHELKQVNALGAFSVREIRKKTDALIVVNAGGTVSYSVPAPAGYLKVNGAVLNGPSFGGENTGIFCIMGTSVSIVPLSRNNLPKCTDAVQRGPILTPELLSILDEPGQQHRRTVVATDSQGRLLIFVTKEGATLPAIAKFLFGSKITFDIGSALNLDGDMSSGMLLVTRGEEEVVGSVDSLIASAIAID